MFGYIKRKTILKLINELINKLKSRQNEIIKEFIPQNDKDRNDFNTAINKLQGGIDYLGVLKNHIE